MSAADPAASGLAARHADSVLMNQWRGLTRAATAVALLTSPAAFLWFHRQVGWGVGWSLLATAGVVIGFRGFVDLTLRRFIPWPSLFGTDDKRIMEDDVVNRRRAWFWHRLFRYAAYILVLITVVWIFGSIAHGSSWPHAAHSSSACMVLTRPPKPVPGTRLRSMPCSSAILRTTGE